PDGDDAAAGVAAFELAWGLRRASVNLHALHVPGGGETSEIGRRLPAVEVILRITPRWRAHHLRAAIVRQTHLLHASYCHQHVHQRGDTAALDLLLREEMTHPAVATPLEVDIAAFREGCSSLDHDLGKLDGKGVQLEVVP